MNNDWYIYALLAPALFAVINLTDDYLLRGVYRSPYFGATISGYFGMVPLIAIFFFPIQIASLEIVVLGILAGLLTVFYYLCYFKGLDSDFPSVVVALLFNIAPIFVVIISYFILQERFTVSSFIGIVLIISASLILSLTELDIKKLRFTPALIPILLGALIYAVIAIISKSVYTEVDFVSGYIYFSVGMGLGAVGLTIFTSHGRKFFPDFRTKFRKWIGIFIVVEFIGLAAELTNNLAISKGPVGLVKVIEGIQPLYVLLFAVLLYPFFPKLGREAIEGNKLKKFLCMITMIIGLWFIFLF